MKITLDCSSSIETEEIIIKCREISPAVIKIMSLAGSTNQSLAGSIDRQIFIIAPEEVYYFESVDDKVFIYTKDKVYESALRLYEIERDYASGGFFRANRSTIINISLIKSLSPMFNGRIEVELENGEKQIVSRQYAPVLKQKLGIVR